MTTEEDESDFDSFYRRMAPRLLGYAYALTGSRPAAEDLVQEAFGRAWARWKRVGRLDVPEAWVRRVVLNQAISDWRKRSSPRNDARRSVPGKERDTGPDDEAVDAVWLSQALHSLPRDQCRAVLLHDGAGLTVPQISSELGVPEGTVKSWISRGRAALAVLLADPEREARP